MATIILLGIILGPLLLLTLLKVNAVFVYLSLCLGDVLTGYVAGNSGVSNLVSSTKVISKFSTSSDIRIGLLILPAVLTTIFMLRTSKGHKLISLNILPALAVGLLAVFLIVPLLPLSVAASISDNAIWTHLKTYQDIIVGASSALVMLMLLLHRSKLGSSSKHHKHFREKG